MQNEGYDGVINEEDGAIWEYVAFNPNQIKSADPVTYDDNGNVIPLSERFNPEKEDIRYSLATDVATILEEYDNVQEIAQAVDSLNKTFPNGSGLLENALEFYKQGNEDEFINVLKATAKLPQKRVKVNNADAKDVTENIFGGIWIADSQEFAKFAKAVNNSPFEEDGEGIAYTDNYFYAYYRNINGESIPYASVYMNEAVSQDIVKKVIKELNDVRTSGRVKERIDSSLEWIRNVQSQNNVNNGDNSGASSRRGDEQLGVVLLRKGRYFDNQSLYVKTSRTDGRGDIDYRYSLRETDSEILEQLNKGRDVLAEFLGTLVKDGALTEAEAHDMMQQMDDIYAFCETMKDHYAPFGQWSEAKVRISAR